MITAYHLSVTPYPLISPPFHLPITPGHSLSTFYQSLSLLYGRYPRFLVVSFLQHGECLNSELREKLLHRKKDLKYDKKLFKDAIRRLRQRKVLLRDKIHACGPVGLVERTDYTVMGPQTTHTIDADAVMQHLDFETAVAVSSAQPGNAVNSSCAFCA